MPMRKASPANPATMPQRRQWAGPVGGDSDGVIGSIGARLGMLAHCRARIRERTVSPVRSIDRW